MIATAKPGQNSSLIGRPGYGAMVPGGRSSAAAPGNIVSPCFRDPHGNLVEIANYADQGSEDR